MLGICPKNKLSGLCATICGTSRFVQQKFIQHFAIRSDEQF